MVYAKTTWATDTALTLARINNAETQYDEFMLVYIGHDHNADFYTIAEMETTFWGTMNDGPGSGSDADQIYRASGDLHAADLGGLGVPSGLIIMWPEAVPPAGWYICDGGNGTHDLRDRFIISAGSLYDPAEIGGEDAQIAEGILSIANHALSAAEVQGHQHSIIDWYAGSAEFCVAIAGNLGNQSGGSARDAITADGPGAGASHGHPGSTIAGDPYENRPPFKAVYFIQKA